MITKNGFITKDGINYTVHSEYKREFAFITADSKDRPDLENVELVFDYDEYKTFLEAEYQLTDERFKEVFNRILNYWVADQYEKGNYQINIV